MRLLEAFREPCIYRFGVAKSRKLYVGCKYAGEVYELKEAIVACRDFCPFRGGRELSIIHFKSEKALKFLITYGVVYTLRPNLRKTGKAWICNNRRKVADATVEYVEKITQSNAGILEEFVSKSGFDSVEEWLNEVKRLNGKIPDVLHLYRITLSGRAGL